MHKNSTKVQCLRDILHVCKFFIAPIHKYSLEKKLIHLPQYECNNMSESNGGKAQRMKGFYLCHEKSDTAFFFF